MRVRPCFLLWANPSGWTFSSSGPPGFSWGLDGLFLKIPGILAEQLQTFQIWGFAGFESSWNFENRRIHILTTYFWRQGPHEQQRDLVCLFASLCVRLSVHLSSGLCLPVGLSVSCLSPSPSFFVSLYLSLSICLSICQLVSVSLSVSPSLCLYRSLSVCLPACLPACLSVCQFLCIFPFLSANLCQSLPFGLCLSLCLIVGLFFDSRQWLAG